MITLSGLTCSVEAKNLNGLIKGSLSCAISAQKFKIDMHPSSANKNKINLYQEVGRLFFTTKKNKIQKQTLSIDRKSAADTPWRASSFLIRLMGSFNKHMTVEIEESSEDSCRVSFSVKGHDVVETISGLRALKLNSRDGAAISQYIQKNMIVALTSPAMSRMLNHQATLNSSQHQSQRAENNYRLLEFTQAVEMYKKE
jgi:hypothetical protein